MCIAVQYVYQCYSCHSTVIKDIHHGPRHPCPAALRNHLPGPEGDDDGDGGGGGGDCVPHLDYCPGLVWESQRRRCCDDIDPRAATDPKNTNDYPYFLLRSEKLCLWCEVQNELRQSGVHAESDVLDTTIPAPPPTAAVAASSSIAVARRKSRTATAAPAVTGHSCSRYWGEADHCHEHVRRHRHRRRGRGTKQKKRRVVECGFRRDSDNDDSDSDEDGGAPLR